MNKQIITGNLTKDPELKKDRNGEAYALFTVAVNEGSGDKKHVDYFFCKAQKKTAENLCQYKKKGDPLLVVGKMRSYKKDGDEYDRWALEASEVEFLAGGKRSEESSSDNGGSKRGRSGGASEGRSEADDEDLF